MKSFIFLSLLAFGLFAHATPDVNFGDHLQVLDLLPVADVVATGNGTGVDMQLYAGQIAIVLDSKNIAGTLPTMALKIQDSADNSTFADVSPSLAFAGLTTVASVQKIVANKDNLRRYIRVVKTIGGSSSPEYYLSLKVMANLKYQQ